jgi:hypothetical protein
MIVGDHFRYLSALVSAVVRPTNAASRVDTTGNGLLTECYAHNASLIILDRSCNGTIKYR